MPDLTEFEAATLSLREAALWIAIAGVLVGEGKLAAICWGNRVMNEISDDWRHDIEARNRRTEEGARQARKRYEEEMAALAELIRRADAPGTCLSSPPYGEAGASRGRIVDGRSGRYTSSGRAMRYPTRRSVRM